MSLNLNSGIPGNATLNGGNNSTGVAAGYIGEQVISTATGTNLATGSLHGVTSIALTAGVWLITATAGVNTGALTGLEASISQSSGGSGSFGNFSSQASAVGTNLGQVVLPNYAVSNNGPSTYWISVQPIGSATSSIICTIQAIRIA